MYADRNCRILGTNCDRLCEIDQKLCEKTFAALRKETSNITNMRIRSRKENLLKWLQKYSTIISENVSENAMYLESGSTTTKKRSK
jgi:hypothetical protein